MVLVLLAPLSFTQDSNLPSKFVECLLVYETMCFFTFFVYRCQILGGKGIPQNLSSFFFPQGFVVFEALKVPAIASYVQHVSCTYYLSRRLSSKSIW